MRIGPWEWKSRRMREAERRAAREKAAREEEMQSRMAMKMSIRQLERSQREMEKKKETMLHIAWEAKAVGARKEYDMVAHGLKMVLVQLKRIQSMSLQLKMLETMKDITSISKEFIGAFSRASEEIGTISQGIDFVESQVEFERGMLAMESVTGQINDFMEEAGVAFQDASPSEPEIDAEIDALVDAMAPDNARDDIEAVQERIEDAKREIDA